MTENYMRNYKVMKRDGRIVDFDAVKIKTAITKAYLEVHGGDALSGSGRDIINKLTEATEIALVNSKPGGGVLHLEHIQDMVELSIMRSGDHQLARAYVLYREARARDREISKATSHSANTLRIRDSNGEMLSPEEWLKDILTKACIDLKVDVGAIYEATVRDMYDGISKDDAIKTLIMSSRAMIEQDPMYNRVTARLMLQTIREEVFGGCSINGVTDLSYRGCFADLVKQGVDAGLLNPRLLGYDLELLAQSIVPERDDKFRYLGLQTLYDRYFLHINGRRIEMPQSFFMRVAMGLALNEQDKEGRVIEFYNLLSNFYFMSSSPTLFNSGTVHSQLSSCYLTTIPDDLNGIYDGIKDNALLSKYAGGLGNDWTRIRAMGSRIKGTNGKSQGVIPFLKVANDTAVAVNQGGKRRGAVCAYLETWHLDIEEFLDLRKNTGDERRRTHDMNTANWIPDLFMKRVHENAEWTLFSPNDTPDLHDCYGESFERLYRSYEEKAERGEIKLFKKVNAVTLWRKMLSMLFETGHPWITFKDACNVRSPQQHIGVVHSSNLCTEITLNTSDDEIAVCNLGSVNLAAHISEKGLDLEKLSSTVRTAMRILDNVIDINYYPDGIVKDGIAIKESKARRSNMQHRPVGLGIMGFQDCLHAMKIPYASDEAVKFADLSMEAIAFFAYSASSELARERGPYPSFCGSLWSKGVLPMDTLEMLKRERGGYVEYDTSSTLPWDTLREQIKLHGMRNSNCLAIAPTATIANIVGVSASIEPSYKNLFVKSNLSGEFTVINEYLVDDLKKMGLWDAVMVQDLKYFDGSLEKIERIPANIKHLYRTAFEIEPKWLIEASARRQKWIDQAQSLNIYISEPNGKKLDETYKLAWVRGLKTTYYLRTLGATHAEKSTAEPGSLNAVKLDAVPTAKVCAIDNPECESCQ